MSDMTIQEFCDRHGACREGREWAMANCQTMADVWATTRFDWLVWVATRRGVLTDRELRLFGVWSARQVQHLMTDPRIIAAMNVSERHASGEATDEAAWEAAWEASWSAARAAAGEEAILAARSEWLRANTTPNF